MQSMASIAMHECRLTCIAMPIEMRAHPSRSNGPIMAEGRADQDELMVIPGGYTDGGYLLCLSRCPIMNLIRVGRGIFAFVNHVCLACARIAGQSRDRRMARS